MEPKAPAAADHATWYCVLDRQMRLLYLGTSESDAQSATVTGSTMRSAAKMGNALRLAAIAFGVESRHRSVKGSACRS